MIDIKNINQQYKYDGDLNNQFAGSYNRLDKMLNIITTLRTAPTRVLDIGCGTGFFANEIKKIYPDAEIIGIDISSKAISIGKVEFKNIKLLVGDTEKKLPFKDNYFDLVISGEHIEHIKDTDNYILEIKRVLMNKGALILTTPNLSFWFNRILLLFGKQPLFLEPSLRKTFPVFTIFKKTFPSDLNHPPAGHLRLYTKDMLLKFLKYYGFNIKNVQGARIFSMFLIKQIDSFFESYPSLAFGLIVKAQNIKH